MWTLGAPLPVLSHCLGCPFWRQGEALRVVRTLQRALLGVALAVVVLHLRIPRLFLGRLAVYSETLDPRSSASELVHRSRDYPLKNFLSAFDYPRCLWLRHRRYFAWRPVCVAILPMCGRSLVRSRVDSDALSSKWELAA